MFFLLANIFIFTASVALCWCLGILFRTKRIFDRWEALRPVELAAALGAVVLNSAVSMLGWWLWKIGWITLKPAVLLEGIADCFLMVIAMDFGMYLFHRAAHHPWIFPVFHRFHHRHEATNPISLFVLHPVEVIGFGLLMTAFLVVFPITLGGLLGFLTLNVLFGTLGHSGVEPFPAFFRSVPVLKLLGTSTFHAEHHEHPRYNFGFYTLLWDKLFSTLDPEYDTRFTRKG